MSANEKTSLIQTTDSLDLNELREKVQGLLEERNERLKELVNGTYNAVMEVADLFRHFAAMHDEVALDAYAQEIRRIQLLEAEQERLRDQIVRFIQATSSSFTEIFHQTPSP